MSFGRGNNMLTICLITQGRDEVQEFIESARLFSELEYINFLVIDNGAPEKVSKILRNWALTQAKITLLVRKENSFNFNELWPVIKEHSSEWVIFPGDDDRLLVEGFVAWKSIVEQDKDLEVVAMSARIIDFQGKETGEIVSPEFSVTGGKVVNLAQALHSPPFFWPTLFIKKSSVEGPFPNSRFLLDWWIGLSLVVNHNVSSSKICTLEYRRHPLQVSNLASLNQKFFEGVYWIDEFLASPIFHSWIKSRDESSLRIFWETVFNNPPLYGDGELSGLLLFNLAKIVILNSPSPELKNQVLADVSLVFGSLQHDASLCELIGNTSESHFGNLKISNENFVCPILSPLLHAFQGSDSSLVIAVSCEHDSSRVDSVYIECSRFIGRTENQQLDLLVRDISTHQEREGLLVFKVSPRERSLVLWFRRYKPWIPGRLLMRLRSRT
jgi:hypothetical protein